MINLKTTFSILILSSLTFTKAEAQSVSFNVRTVTYSGTYAPNHVFALWVTNASGQYVKTINRQSKNYTQNLTTWYSNSGNNTLDGLTGASLTTHNAPLNKTGGVSRIPFTWDCKDKNGTMVADGTYNINVEFSEDSNPKYIKYTFVKGPSNQSLTFTNVTTSPGKYFQDATLTFTALPTAINNTESFEKYDVSFYNSTKQLQIKFEAQYHQSVSLFIYNEDGKLLNKNVSLNPNTAIDLSKFQSGIYMVKLTDKAGKNQTSKILIK